MTPQGKYYHPECVSRSQYFRDAMRRARLPADGLVEEPPCEYIRNAKRLPRYFCAVYLLRNKRTGAVYVGGTTNLRARLLSHWIKISNGRGTRAIRAGFPNGAVDLEFEILEKCPLPYVANRESYWIKRLKPSLNKVIPKPVALVR